MSSSTVVANNGATVPASGFYTQQGVTQVNNLLANTKATITVFTTEAAIPSVPAGQNGNYVLVIPNGVAAGAVSIPAGYGAVIFGEGSSASVTGGDATTTVLSAGSISYNGAAAVVDMTNVPPTATGTINDTAAGATIDLGGGSYSVTSTGAGSTVQIDNGASVAAIASGIGDTIQIGDPSIVGTAASFAFAPGPTTVTVGASGGDAVINIRENVLLVDNNSTIGADTISGIAGTSTIFAATGDVYFGSGGVTEFIGASTGSQTIFGGTGNDTVFAQGANTLYNEGTGTNHIFVGGTGDSTVIGQGSGAVFGGTGHLTDLLGNGNDMFVGTGGSDSIYGGSVTPTIFASGTGELTSVIGSHAAFEVAAGTNSVIDASLTSGGNEFFALSTTGNTTLVGAAIGTGDNFNLASVAGGTAHSLTIQNWHTGDGLFLNGYGAADQSTMDTAINGGASTFTLSDGTTVQFSGNHPAHAIGSGAF